MLTKELEERLEELEKVFNSPDIKYCDESWKEVVKILEKAIDLISKESYINENRLNEAISVINEVIENYYGSADARYQESLDEAKQMYCEIQYLKRLRDAPV